MTARGGLWAVAAVAALSACAARGGEARSSSGLPGAPPPALPPPLLLAPRDVPASWSYWQPVEPNIPAGATQTASLPLSGDAFMKWAAGVKLPENAREKLRRDGVVVVEADAAPVRVGALYAADPSAPSMITLDALAAVTRGALDAAIAETEDRVIKPALARLIARLEVRLTELARSPGADLAEPLALARGVVAVARSLSGSALGMTEPKAFPRKLREVVAAERARIEAHEGLAPSPLLGTVIDYSSIGLDRAPPERLGLARALAWLGGAPLMLSSVAEQKASPSDVGTARTQTRAAMVLGALLDDKTGDQEAAQAFARILRVLTFVYGPADDVGPMGLHRVAGAAKVRLEDPDEIADVTKVDRLRRRAIAEYAPRVWDGAGDIEVPARPLQSPKSVPRAALSFRLLGGHAALDAAAIQSLVFPSVGALVGGGAPFTARDGVRVLPCILDVAAWLGAKEAETGIRESGDDAYVAFQETRARLLAARPKESAAERHESLNGSAIDLLFAYVAPSSSHLRAPATPSFERFRVESALAVWLQLARLDRPFARPPPLARSPVKGEGRGSARVVVEPHPEAMGRLLALVRQARRGLVASGLDAKGHGVRALLAAEAIVDAAFLASVRQGRNEALTPDESASMAHLPSQIRALEDVLGDRAAVTRSTDVHVDGSGQRVLVAGSGALERAWIALPAVGSRSVELLLAAHTPMYEKVVGPPERAQLGWRAEVTRSPPRRLSIAASFRAP